MVAIIIINYNHSEMTIDCVNSVLDSDFENFRILLIDNGSESHDFDKINRIYSDNLKISVYRIDKNCGYVGAVNFGLKNAQEMDPGYYLIMNNDTRLDVSAISELVKSAEKHEQRAIISGKVYHFDRPNVIQQTGMIFYDHKYIKGTYPGKDEPDIGQYDQEAERDSLDDIFWLIPSTIFNDVGYYCNYFYLYAEQGDYAQRVRRKGYKLIYTPNARIWHKGSVTTGDGKSTTLPICYWRGKGTFIFQYRNLKRKYFILLAINNFIRYVIKSIVFKGENKRYIRAKLSGYFAGLLWLTNKKPDDGYNPYLARSK